MELTRKQIFDVYLSKSWKLIPLKGKIRITKENEIVDIHQYEDIKYNIGVLTGNASNLVVIDFDNVPDDLFDEGD